MHSIASFVTILCSLLTLHTVHNSGFISAHVSITDHQMKGTSKMNSDTEPTPTTLVYVYDDQYKQRLTSRVENSFDTYRRELTKYMAQVDEVVTVMTRLDEFSMSGKESVKTSCPLKKVHDKFKIDIKKIPELWERNEEVLRLLLQPRSMKLTSVLLNSSSKQILYTLIHSHQYQQIIRSITNQHHQHCYSRRTSRFW